MSIPITFNGVEYDIPEFRDVNYANELTQFFTAIPNGVLQPTAGLFTLLAEVDFGASFGLKSLYVKSRAANPAAAGIFRLGNAESVSWRNAANSADLALLVNASNELMFNGAQVLTGSGPSSYVSSLTGTANQVIASASTGAVTLSLPQSIATTSNLRFGNLTLNGAADASALLTLTSTSQGFLPPRMTTVQRDAIASPAEGLVIYNTTTGQMNLYASGVWAAFAASGGGTVNSGTQNRLTYYAANGTVVSSLAAITPNSALISDANGLPVASVVSNTELALLSGIASNVQTQLNARALDSAVVHNTGTETIAGAKSFSSALAVASGVNITGLPPALNMIRTAGNTASIFPAVLAANRDYTIPDAGANASFVMTEGAQSLNGAKTFADLRGTLGAALAAATFKITGLGNGTAIQDAAAFGQVKVLQVVQGTATAEVSSTSGTYADTGLTASITPSNANNKVLVIVSQSVRVRTNDGTSVTAGLRLTRAATDIISDQVDSYSTGAGTLGSVTHQQIMMILDSPSTTSATAYKTRIARNAGTGTVFVQDGSTGTAGWIMLIEVNGL